MKGESILSPCFGYWPQYAHLARCHGEKHVSRLQHSRSGEFPLSPDSLSTCFRCFFLQEISLLQQNQRRHRIPSIRGHARPLTKAGLPTPFLPPVPHHNTTTKIATGTNRGEKVTYYKLYKFCSGEKSTLCPA